jgi:myosin heavy subunit
LKLKKLANWFSDEDPEKNKLEQPPQQTDVKSDTKLAKMQSTIEKLTQELQKSHKELAQTKAQLQINQGFQIELGETQLKLQTTAAELQRYKQELFEQQKQLSSFQAEHQKTQQTLAQMIEQHSWPSSIETPVQVIEIKKTLPKQEFETLWGFGIMSPAVETIITTGAILVRGWVLGKKAQAKTVKVLYQGKTLLETTVNLRRPIIAQQYPDILTAGQSGFEFSLAVTGISTETELNIEACLQDETIVSLCNLVLKPQTIESNDTQSLILD